MAVRTFISEDDLQTFDGWLGYQAIDVATNSPEELNEWRRIFDESRQASVANGKVGLMNLRPRFGEYRYAVSGP